MVQSIPELVLHLYVLRIYVCVSLDQFLGSEGNPLFCQKLSASRGIHHALYQNMQGTSTLRELYRFDNL